MFLGTGLLVQDSVGLQTSCPIFLSWLQFSPWEPLRWKGKNKNPVLHIAIILGSF